MAIQGKALLVADPDVSYDKRAIHFQIIPCFGPTAVNVSWRGLAYPYRVLKNGTIELRPGDPIEFGGADAYDDAKKDPAVAAALGLFEKALQDFVTAKGV